MASKEERLQQWKKKLKKEGNKENSRKKGRKIKLKGGNLGRKIATMKEGTERKKQWQGTERKKERIEQR